MSKWLARGFLKIGVSTLAIVLSEASYLASAHQPTMTTALPPAKHAFVLLTSEVAVQKIAQAQPEEFRTKQDVIEQFSKVMLENSNYSFRDLALLEIFKVGLESSVPVRHLVAGKKSDFRTALGSIPSNIMDDIQPSDIVPFFVYALEDTHPTVRITALQALAQKAFGNESYYLNTVDLVRLRLQDKDSMVRRQAVLSLLSLVSNNNKARSCLNDPTTSLDLNINSVERAFEDLLPLIRDSDAIVRHTVVSAVGCFEDSRAINAIISTLGDQERIVQAQALATLKKMNKPEVIANSLVQHLNSSDVEKRKIAAATLGEFRTKSGISSLIISLQDSDSKVRLNSINSLNKLRAIESSSALVGSLKDSDSDVRFLATRTLFNFKSDAIDSLVLSASSKDSTTRWESIDVLSKVDLGLISESHTEQLIQSLNGSDDSLIRGHLLELIRKQNYSSVTATLLKTVEKSAEETPINRYRAINALTSPQHLQFLAQSKALLQRLSDLALNTSEDSLVRYGAFSLLAAINNSDSIALLNDGEKEFLTLAENNYTINLPFYLPEPLNIGGSQPSGPFEPVLVAANPFGSDFQPILPSIRQGDLPRKNREATTALLADRPALCIFPWVDRKWKRCKT